MQRVFSRAIFCPSPEEPTRKRRRKCSSSAERSGAGPSPSPSLRSWVSAAKVPGVSWGLGLLGRSVCLPSLRGLLHGRGARAVSAVGPAGSWRAQLPRRTRHLEMGDASSASLGRVSADEARAGTVLPRLAKLLRTVSRSSAWLLSLPCFLLCQETDKWWGCPGLSDDEPGLVCSHLVANAEVPAEVPQPILLQGSLKPLRKGCSSASDQCCWRGGGGCPKGSSVLVGLGGEESVPEWRSTWAASLPGGAVRPW